MAPSRFAYVMFSPTTQKNNIFYTARSQERCRRNHLQKSSRPGRCDLRSGWEGAMTSTNGELNTLMTPTCWYCLKIYFWPVKANFLPFLLPQPKK